MHRTLKAQTARHAAADLRAQQRRFHAFWRRYNEVRPHEALGQQPPSAPLTRRPRARCRAACRPSISVHYEVRRISAPSNMSWHSRNIAVSTVLIGEQIALEPIDDGEWDLHFGPILLGLFDERHHRITPAGARVR